MPSKKGKGKKPMQTLAEEPEEDSSEKTLADEPEQSSSKKTPTEQPEEDSSKKTSAEQPVPGSSKGTQLLTQLIYGHPRFLIARIPIDKDGRIKAVRVPIMPDTALRHPQTFFFKNIPNVDRYWGYTNDQAFTARRIVRLEREGKPTPYFLFACRGEHPVITSPFNYNAIFEGLAAPVFADAFLLKLGNPEVFEDGYARYVNIEKDIGSFDWLREAVRGAAEKIEDATASDANAGFPDMMTYADEATRRKDVKKMDLWKRTIASAIFEQVTSLHSDGEHGFPDVEALRDSTKDWATLVNHWNEMGALPTDLQTQGPEIATVQNFFNKVQDFSKALKDAIVAKNNTEVVKEPLAGCSGVNKPPDTKKAAYKKLADTFLVVKVCFLAVQAIAVRSETAGNVGLAYESDPGDEESGNYRYTQKQVTFVMARLEEWRKRYHFPHSVDAIISDVVTKGRATVEMMDKGRSNEELEKAISEYDVARNTLNMSLDGQTVIPKLRSPEANAG